MKSPRGESSSFAAFAAVLKITTPPVFVGAVQRTFHLFDYMEKLIHDIMEKFPPGKVPPLDQTSQRFTAKELEELLKGPLKGGKHLYTVAWPAY